MLQCNYNLLWLIFFQKVIYLLHGHMFLVTEWEIKERGVCRIWNVDGPALPSVNIFRWKIYGSFWRLWISWYWFVWFLIPSNAILSKIKMHTLCVRDHPCHFPCVHDHLHSYLIIAIFGHSTNTFTHTNKIRNKCTFVSLYIYIYATYSIWYPWFMDWWLQLKRLNISCQIAGKEVLETQNLS